MSIAESDIFEPALPSIVLNDARKLPAAGGGVRLRSEAVDISTKEAESWRYLNSQFGRYVKMKTESQPVFQNRQTGERFSPEANHRFSRKHSHDRYGQILRGERGLLVRYDNPHTALITLTAPVRSSAGPHHLPIDRHTAINDSYDFVRQKLNYEINRKRDLDYEYIAINGPTRHGNALGHDHIHLAVWVDGSVERETFRPVLDKHVEKCDIATEAEHPPEQAITVEQVNVSELEPFGQDVDFGPTTSLSRYVGGHLPAIGAEADVRDKPAQFARHGALSWATGTRTFRASEAFRETNSEGSGDWEHVGIETASGRFVGTDEMDDSGGTRWVETNEPDMVRLSSSATQTDPPL